MMNTTGEIRTADSAPVVVSSGYVWYSPADWWRFLKRWPILPVLVLVAVVLGAVFANQISPHEPDKGNLRARDIPPLWFEGSSTEHPSAQTTSVKTCWCAYWKVPVYRL